MSSMFKKKGAPAFKPKVPSARARPVAAPAAPAPVSKPVKASVVLNGPGEEPSRDVSSVQKPSDSRPESQKADVPAEFEFESESQPPQPKRRRRSSAVSISQDADVRTRLAGTAEKNVQVVVEDELAQAPSDSIPSVDSETAKPVQSVPLAPSRQTRASQTPAPMATEASSSRPEPPPSTEIQEPEPVEAASESQLETVAAAAAAAADGDDDDDDAAPSSVTTVEPKPTRTTRRQASTTTTETAEKDGEATPTQSRRKRTRKTAAADGDEAPARPRKRSAANANANAGGTGERAAGRPRRARSATPEDSETQLVDLQTLKMSDLTRDLHIGKKFSRHDELRERERQARIKTKLNKDGLALNNGDASPSSSAPLAEESRRDEGGGEKAESTPSGDSGSGGGGGNTPAAGPQFRIVDGQIVLDQSSLVMDRHARAAAAQAGTELETVEENDFSRLITSSSFMRSATKLRGPNIWTAAETELFYRGLGMFGTEFQMISHMFPGKQRRHVKLKFNREERCNAARVDAALTGEKTTKMDLDEYKALTGAQFEPVEDIMAEQRRIEQGYEAERRRIADEQAETMRRKREELFADDGGGDGDGDGDDADNATKIKKKGRKKKGKQVEYGLNGKPIVNKA